MERPAGQNVHPHRARNDAGRRSWSIREEEVLMAGLKELTADGWKSDNGFRGGYLQQLEHIMKRTFPDTDLKGSPHINSRITTWKRSYASLFSMLSKTGIGLNASHMIEATPEIWEAHVKIDPNARLMKHKNWPLYADWCEVFGKDRATGVGAEDFGEASAAATAATQGDTEDTQAENNEAGAEEEEDTEAMSDSMPESSAADKSTSGSKRKACAGSDHLLEIVSSFCQATSSHLSELAQRIGYEKDISKARSEIYGYVLKIEGLSLRQKLRATHLQAEKTEDVDIFLGLPDEAKEEWTCMKLDGSV